MNLQNIKNERLTDSEKYILSCFDGLKCFVPINYNHITIFKKDGNFIFEYDSYNNVFSYNEKLLKHTGDITIHELATYRLGLKIRKTSMCSIYYLYNWNYYELTEIPWT